MSFLRLLERIRLPFFDSFFLLITSLGEETVFLAVAIFVFWCLNKREGYYILTVGLVGTVVNQALKLMCKIPRPWKTEGFTAVAEAIPEATGYSFPSGHTQNAVGTFGGIARCRKSRPVRIFLIVLISLIAFSRMYLGVHTPHDVAFSLVFGAVLVFGLHPLFSTEERFDRFMPYVAVISSLVCIAHTIYVFAPSHAGVDAEIMGSTMKNAATLFGCTLALIPVYLVDRYIIKFDTGAKWYVQIIKLVIGLAAVLLIKEGLKSPLLALLGNLYTATALRYFIIVIFAGIVWPFTFRYLTKIKIPFLDRIHLKRES